MIQGGGFEIQGKQMLQKKTELPVENKANNGLKNERATIAMARTSDPNSATAQFFINHKDNDFLDFKSETPQGWGYCVFGKVVQGEEVIDKIAAVKTHSVGGHKDVPVAPVMIEKATLLSP